MLGVSIKTCMSCDYDGWLNQAWNLHCKGKRKELHKANKVYHASKTSIGCMINASRSLLSDTYNFNKFGTGLTLLVFR